MRQFIRDCWDGVHEELAGVALVCLLFFVVSFSIGIIETLDGHSVIGFLYLCLGPLHTLMYWLYNDLRKERDQYRKEIGIGKQYGCEMYHEITLLRKTIVENAEKHLEELDNLKYGSRKD